MQRYQHGLFVSVMEKGGYGEPQPAGYGQPITPPPSYGQPAPSYGQPDTMPVSSQPQHTAITVVQAPQVNKLQHYREHLPKRIHLTVWPRARGHLLSKLPEECSHHNRQGNFHNCLLVCHPPMPMLVSFHSKN